VRIGAINVSLARNEERKADSPVVPERPQRPK